MFTLNLSTCVMTNLKFKKGETFSTIFLHPYYTFYMSSVTEGSPKPCLCVDMGGMTLHVLLCGL